MGNRGSWEWKCDFVLDVFFPVALSGLSKNRAGAFRDTVVRFRLSYINTWILTDFFNWDRFCKKIRLRSFFASFGSEYET